jgi:hypothetical protein
VDFGELRRKGIFGLIAAAVLIVSVFLPWFSLTDTPERVQQDAWICGDGETSCNAWDTFPIGRFLFLLAALAPILLTYFVLTAQKGKYPTGEVTMTVGFAVITLVVFNGIIDKPGEFEFGISLDYGYFLALAAGLLMAVSGALRSLEHGGGAERRPPGTF